MDLFLPGNPEPAATRVVVAMSGGVDSSVTAGLVKEAGYDAVGITLQLYDHGQALQKKGACCAGQDIHDARDAADRLGIPHYVLDYESRFREQVINTFADSYLAGETPIPCVSCNQTVKFSDLLKTARELGAAALVTGHYALTKPEGGHMAMYRPADLDRDQSYFLFATTQEQLDFVRFPLGRLTKAETRAHAARMGLAIADKPDSQDICFVPNGSYADIIAKLRPEAAEPGAIVHVDGHELGRHDGIVHFTVGQRRGLGVAAGEPLYVVKIDAKARQVIVGPREALGVRRIALRDFNWIGGDVDWQAGLDVAARVRSARPPQEARVRCEDGVAVVDLVDGETGVAPGQACVLYANDGPGARVLGGGFIAKTTQSFELAPANAAARGPLGAQTGATAS
ncbi:MAG: tRNA 2-thiouridine(34) synthase MnmA [Devosiaceae bacterium]|nr:tRNA 2-thiouridine(34) synthase MnmA [Devosiaceae bacterium MH13]